MARPDQVFFLREAFEKRFCFARAVRSRGMLFISGVTSVDADGKVVGIGDMRAQLRHVFETLGIILAQHGLTFEHVVKETMFATDMVALVAANGVREEAYQSVAPPAATGVEVAALLHPDMMIEIELIAEFPDA